MGGCLYCSLCLGKGRFGMDMRKREADEGPSFFALVDKVVMGGPVRAARMKRAARRLLFLFGNG